MAARLAAAEALVGELRARLEALTGELSDTQVELAAARDKADAANIRALAAVDAEQADAKQQAHGLWLRLRAAWRK